VYRWLRYNCAGRATEAWHHPLFHTRAGSASFRLSVRIRIGPSGIVSVLPVSVAVPCRSIKSPFSVKAHVSAAICDYSCIDECTFHGFLELLNAWRLLEAPELARPDSGGRPRQRVLYKSSATNTAVHKRHAQARWEAGASSPLQRFRVLRSPCCARAAPPEALKPSGLD
jgi:hypothetical protein